MCNDVILPNIATFNNDDIINSNIIKKFDHYIKINLIAKLGPAIIFGLEIRLGEHFLPFFVQNTKTNST